MRKARARKGFLRRLRQSGNVLFTVFALLAGAGVIGATTMGILRGPVAGTAKLSKQKIAATAMDAAARLVGSPHGPTADCDSDGSLEPVAWQTPAGSAPTPSGGGLLPAALGAAKADPWGTSYGYCVWDHGTHSVSDDVAGCGGAGANRLQGADTETDPVIAIISAGPDKVFQTACAAWVDADSDGNPDMQLVGRAGGSDDVIRTETLETLVKVGGTAQIPSLPDEACTPETLGLMRFELDTVQICTEDGWEEAGVAITADGTFTPVDGVELSTEHTSNTISFSGYFGTRTAVVDNGAVIIVNGVDQGASAEIAAGDTVAIRGSAAAVPATPVVFTFAMSAIQRPWVLTTRNPTPASLSIQPTTQGGMDVAGPGSPATGATVSFLVRNTGETPTTLIASQLSNTTNFAFATGGMDVGDDCAGKTLGFNDTCVVDVRPQASDDGALSGTLTARDGTLTEQADLSGTATGWSCTVSAGTSWAVGGSTCTVPSALTIASGVTAGTTDSTSPTVGSATYACSAAVATLQAGATCITEDTTPTAFSFTDQTNQQLNTLRTSNTITITGINTGTPVSVSGSGSPQISIDGGGWVTSGTINNNDTLRVRLTSANAFSSARSATVNVGGVTDSWSVTTRAASGCSNTTMRWTNSSSGPCQAASGSMTHGQTKSVNNTASGYTGSRNLSCSDGTISQSGGSCAAAGPICGPFAQRYSCNGSVIAQVSLSTSSGTYEDDCAEFCESHSAPCCRLTPNVGQQICAAMTGNRVSQPTGYFGPPWAAICE